MVPGCLELFLGTFGKLSLDFSCWIPKHILVLIHGLSYCCFKQLVQDETFCPPSASGKST